MAQRLALTLSTAVLAAVGVLLPAPAVASEGSSGGTGGSELDRRGTSWDDLGSTLDRRGTSWERTLTSE